MDSTFVFLLVVLACVVIVGGLGLWAYGRRKARGEYADLYTKPGDTKPRLPGEPSDTSGKPEAAGEILKKKARAETALQRTRDAFSGALKSFLGKPSLTPAQWEEVEEALLSADVGVSVSQKFLDQLKARIAANNQSAAEFNNSDLVAIGKELLGSLPHGAPSVEGRGQPLVISVVGVNGVGKTTTVGKLAHWYRSQGKSVLVGAADTFRAAAMEQLKIWADRTGAEYVSGREQGDPGAVVFDALSAGKARNSDVVIIDTAGRLHTKQNLMEELGRIHRVMQKVIPDAPHEVWLVLDGNLGQNSVRQAKEFSQILPLSGVIVTKLDGSAKGGALFAIASELNLPIRFLGLGEAAEDLVPFEPERFVQALVGPAVA